MAKKLTASRAAPPPPTVPGESAVILRSTVPTGLHYLEYRPNLRRDFYCSCAYCTIAETEAKGLSYEIDHYEPQTARSDLIHDYGNLFYACKVCNQRKGNRTPPSTARAAGHRFFRSDQDVFVDHFIVSGKRLTGKTNTGDFTVEFLDLNRDALMKIRDLRRRLTKCEEHVAQGVVGLRRFPIDQLPPKLKGQAYAAIRDATNFAEYLADDIDRLLYAFARSPLLDDDPEAEKRTRARKVKSDSLRALYPGEWRSSRAAEKLPKAVKKRRTPKKAGKMRQKKKRKS